MAIAPDFRGRPIFVPECRPPSGVLQGEFDVAKPEWGVKRTCQSCGAIFYDMRRSPITCPKCGTEHDPEAVLKSRRGRAQAPDEAKPVAVAEQEPEAAVEEADTEKEAASEDEDEADVIEDTSDLGEDEDDLDEVMENVDENEKE